MASPRDKLLNKKSDLSESRTVSNDDHPAASSSQMQNGTYMMVDINLIQTDPNQPRKYFDPEKLAELAESIKANNLIQPVVIRFSPNRNIILVAGERRYRASLAAGVKQIPAVVRNDNPAEIQLIENLLRDDLRPLEKAEGLKMMMDNNGYSSDEAAERLHMHKVTVSEILSLNRLPDAVKETVRHDGENKYPHRLLVALAKCDTPAKAIKLFDKYNKNILSAEEIKELTRKKPGSRATSAQPAVINKRINGLGKYIERNVTKYNINDIFDNLLKLRDTIEKSLELAEQFSDNKK